MKSLAGGGHTEGVDNAVALLLHTGETTDPFTAISQGTMSLNLMRAIERGRKEIPCQSLPRGSESQLIEYGRQSRLLTDGVRRPGRDIGREATKRVSRHCAHRKRHDSQGDVSWVRTKLLDQAFPVL
jgi:hypothetical protein